jgi:hypothetical protein
VPSCTSAVSNRLEVKSLQLSLNWRSQLVAIDQSSYGMALLVDCDEPKQSRDHLLTRSMICRHRIGKGCISLTYQRALNSAELVVARHGKPSAATDVHSKLGKSERQEWECFPGIGVFDQPFYQFGVQCDTGYPSRLFNHCGQCILA